MSCDWNVHCLDCDDTYRFDDANHQLDLMRLLVRHANAIAALAPMMEDVEKTIGSDGVELKTYYGRVCPSWFADHRGHRLVPRDEYGRCDDECGKYVACPTCTTRHNCRLPRDHVGDCSLERPVP